MSSLRAAVLVATMASLGATFAWVPVETALRWTHPATPAEWAELDASQGRMREVMPEYDADTRQMLERSMRTERAKYRGEWVRLQTGVLGLTRFTWAWRRDPLTRQRIGMREVESGEIVRWSLVFAYQAAIILLGGGLLTWLQILHRRRLRRDPT